MSIFAISEIYSVLVEHVAKDSLESRSKYNTTRFAGAETLANLAVTCKNFSEEALNKLWEYQPSIVNLVLCLPSDALALQHTSTPRSGHKLATLLRPLNPEDFRRVSYYAQKVKILGSTQPTSDYRRETQLASNVLPAVLAQHRGNQALFPRLTALNARVHDFFVLSLCEGKLFGDDLKSVLLKGRIDPSEPLWSLEQLPWIQTHRVLSPHLPNLKTFGVYFECDEERELPCAMPTELEHIIRDIRAVERLTIGDVECSWTLLQHIASFPTLNRLELSLALQTTLPDPTTFAPLVFPCLRTMNLTVPGPHTGAKLLRLMFLPIITSVLITIDRTNPQTGTWSINPILRAISAQPGRAHITSLAIGRLCCDPDESEDVEPIDGGSLTHLLPLSGLRHLEINLNAPIQLDADIFERMGQSWPYLRSLSLAQRLTPVTPTLRLGDILPLANSCPTLGYLSLRVDASANLPEKYGDHRNFQYVEDLDVCTSPISDPRAVANFLSCIMPRLKQVRFGWKYWVGNGFWPDPMEDLHPLDAEYHNGWQEVNEILQDRVMNA